MAVPAGSIRFNTDSAKMEIYNGDKWWNIDSTSPTEQTGGTRGVHFGGGDPGRDDVIQYINIDTTGNAVSFGTLAAGNVWGSGAVGSRTRGVFWAGENQYTKLDYVTFASTGNATSFGTSANNNNGGSGVNNSTRGVFGIAGVNTMEYITIASLGNTVDFGDSTSTASTRTAPMNSPTRGVLAGGYGPSPYPHPGIIEYITTSTLGNAADFGDLITSVSGASGASNAVRGVVMNGYTFPSPATVYYNNIEYITMATLGNSTDFGDMSDAVSQGSGASSPTRAVSMGGTKAPGDVDVIDYIQIMTTGNAIDFGNLLAARRGGSASSNGNGGLG
tara:strand:- start:226 stop:1221 length:996 start_codon:yes stop_codon:yes gene_type:complete